MNTTTTTTTTATHQRPLEVLVDESRSGTTMMMNNLQHQDSIISGSSSNSVSPTTTTTVAAAICLSCQQCCPDNRIKDNDGVDQPRRRRSRANLSRRRFFGMGRTTIGLLTLYNILYLLVFLSLVHRHHAPPCCAAAAAQQPSPTQSTLWQQDDDPPSASRTTTHSSDDDDVGDDDGLSSSSKTTTTTTTAAALATPQQEQQQQDLEPRPSRHDLNEELGRCHDAVDRIRLILRYAQQHGLRVVQTTSFGIQSALMLQLLALATADEVPMTTNSNHNNTTTTNVPVIFIDTGYLHPETYRYAEQLKGRYGLDLHVYQSDMTPARMEALYGKLWQQQSNNDDDGAAAHRRYNTMRKVIPMETALHDLRADIILTGLRAAQTSHRRHHVSYVNLDRPQKKKSPSSESESESHKVRWKVCPILDWEDDAVDAFFTKYALPHHPLYAQGYRTVGDWHSSARYDPSVHATVRDSRFHGKAQECGLHTSTTIRDDDDDNDDEDDNDDDHHHVDHHQPLWSDNGSFPVASRTTVPQTIVTRELLSSFDTSSSWDQSSLSHHNNSGNSNDHDVKNDNKTTSTNTNTKKTIVDDDDNGFVLYGRPGCKYCRAAQKLLAGVAKHVDVGVPVTLVEVGKDISPEELVRRLSSVSSSMEESGSGGDNSNNNNATTTTIRTVPQIVYRGRRIGGYTDLVSWGAVHYSTESSLSSSAAASRTFVELSRAIVVDQV